MRCKIIITALGTIEFSDWGKGEPVLIIHGGHSNCQERLFHKGIDLKQFRLIIPSRPGYGSTLHYLKNTPENTSVLFVDLLNHLQLEKVTIYGVSAGGLTAIALAGYLPGRIKKLVLASAVSKKWMTSADTTYKMAKLIFNPKVEQWTWTIIRKFSAIAPRLVAQGFHSQFSTKRNIEIEEKETYEIVEALNRYRSKEGFMADISQYRINDTIFNNITCPTLIIHSNYDNAVPVEHAMYANEMIRNSRLIILDNDWGHLLWIGKDSNRSTNIIFEFLKK